MLHRLRITTPITRTPNLLVLPPIPIGRRKNLRVNRSSIVHLDGRDCCLELGIFGGLSGFLERFFCEEYHCCAGGGDFDVAEVDSCVAGDCFDKFVTLGDAVGSEDGTEGLGNREIIIRTSS